ncbi:BlaI/MecI/CopY family transcriptional regulator [Neolewinella antarctica]|uniref:Transcriptional regulator n=1 Tax=Neolewinella antarctica TaxID=442734 RepID=A0ABX0XBL2_9BACT|nr:BlaI/MecI/CopY family transcriptional regulator [Neolewinella antarctica]NJC26592.1 putative transcriptional regulator [Neolewinella antarctica]
MQKLTAAQEEIMNHVWDLGECTVGDVRKSVAKQRGGKLPAHSTVSTVMAALKDRGFLTHKAYGRTFVYRPALGREEYGSQSLVGLIKSFFGGSASLAVSHLVEREDLNLEELGALVRKLEEE